MTPVSLYIAKRLELDIARDRAYRSNPDNFYHFEYQSSVNRIFATVIILMFLGASIGIFGGTNVFIGIIALLVSAGLTFAVGVMLTIIFREFWVFLSGR